MKKIKSLIIIGIIIILLGCKDNNTRVFNDIEEVNFQTKIIEDSQSFEIADYTDISKFSHKRR